MDLEATKALVGYQPQDDAFEWFDIGLRNQDRWYDEAGLEKPNA